jgi:DNA-binding response OmpR family regulator
VCHAVRPNFKQPILMLTANDDDLSEVAALNAGIDDYLSKPVRPYVLLARIRALFRRVEGAEEAGARTQFRVQDLELDTEARTLTQAGQLLSLTESEFQLLALLCEGAGSVVSRDSLHDSLRGAEAKALDRSVDMRISKLRKRLGDITRPYRYIRTIRSAGYILLTTPST